MTSRLRLASWARAALPSAGKRPAARPLSELTDVSTWNSPPPVDRRRFGFARPVHARKKLCSRAADQAPRSVSENCCTSGGYLGMTGARGGLQHPLGPWNPAPIKAGRHPVTEMNSGDGASLQIRRVEDQQIASFPSRINCTVSRKPLPSGDAAERGAKTGSLSASPSGTEKEAVPPDARSNWATALNNTCVDRGRKHCRRRGGTRRQRGARPAAETPLADLRAGFPAHHRKT